MATSSKLTLYIASASRTLSFLFLSSPGGPPPPALDCWLPYMDGISRLVIACSEAAILTMTRNQPGKGDIRRVAEWGE